MAEHQTETETMEMPPAEAPPATPPEMPPDLAAESMTSNEPEAPQGFLAGFWGIIIFFVLIGLIIGPLLWWIWGRSPLRLWLKLTVTILPIIILAVII